MLFITVLIVIGAIFLFYLNFFIIWKKLSSHDKKFESLVKYISISAIIFTFIIPFISSTFFFTPSYFQNLYLWFFILGFIFIGVGIILIKELFDQHDEFPLVAEIYEYHSEKAYSFVRHPFYSSLLLIFLGLSFICDSPFSILLFPVLFLFFEFLCYLQENKISSEKFPEQYEAHLEKVEKRIFPPPYNFLIFIIYSLVLFIGLRNLVLL